MSSNSNVLCRFYSRGKLCKYGDACRYQHTIRDLSSLSDLQSSTPNQEESVENISESNFSQQKSLNNQTHNEGLRETQGSDQQSFNLQNSIGNSDQRKVCRFYSKHHTCAFGKNCRFIHIEPLQNAATVESEIPPVAEQDKQQSQLQEVEHLPADEEDGGNASSVTGELDESSPKQNDEKEEKICEFFARRGWCRFGRRCHFRHVRNRSKAKPSQQASTETDGGHGKSEPPLSQKGKTQVRRICTHFQQGFCRAGGQCRFWHPIDVMEDVSDDIEKSFKTKVNIEENSCQGEHSVAPTQTVPFNQETAVQPRLQSRQVFKPINQKISVNKATATHDEIEKLRATEIDQLKKRFARDHSTEVDESPDMFQCRVVFRPTDPDWPFDVKQFELLFSIPLAYPEKMMTITLPEDQGLPETVRSFIESCVQDWLKDKEEQLEKSGTYEIIFRPFLRWFDRNLESQVTEALRQLKRQMVAKAAGFEFINAAELQEKYKQTENAESDSQEEVSEGNSEEEVSGEEHDDDDDSEDAAVETSAVKFDPDTEKAGTEVSLKNFQLREGAGTLIFQKVHVVIQCGRCKHHTDFVTPPGRINAISCGKCSQSQIVAFRPVILHHFSSVIGYLDLDNCTAFDVALQDSGFVVGCMKCNKESKFDGLVPGQVFDTYCRHCHEKLRIAADAVRFAQLEATGITTDPKMKIYQVAVKKLKVPKDPAIQEGKPLPDNGTCKHYKKSYRWFRFPCCGMVYPCDICHEEKSDGHEMVFANRVVCGFCCKEQPYAPEKPCLSCMQMLTRAKSSHWEGGLGCRNKVKMSKNDSQKYANLNKTMSKHAQKLKEASSKKTKKPRQT